MSKVPAIPQWLTWENSQFVIFIDRYGISVIETSNGE